MYGDNDRADCTYSSPNMTFTSRPRRCDNMLLSDRLILIVDDSEVDRFTYRRYLESASNLGCHILECESAADALQVCAQEHPDIILLDYLLPDADGLDFLRDLAKQSGTLPLVIMLTGQGNETVAVEVMKYGVKDYLVKRHLTAQKLVATVSNVLTEQNLQTQIEQQRQQRELFATIALKISHAVELPSILQAAVDGAQEILNCDRTLIYRTGHDLSGTIIAESVWPDCLPALGSWIENNHSPEEQATQVASYLQGHNLVISDVELANPLDWQVQMHRQFQVKAVLVVPILCRDILPFSQPRLWGLLIAHHCKKIHEWNTGELNLLDELSLQIAIAIQQAELLSDLQATLENQKVIEYQLRDQLEEIEQSNLLLSQATGLLEERNQALDDFSHIASHDLKAPLRGISNLADWLVQDLEGQLPAENQHQLALIQSRVVQMNALINGLLQYALVGREHTGFVPVNISQLLAEVIDLLAPPAEFQIKFPADLPTIKTPVMLLKQVLANLIGNAIKYHQHPHGQIEIEVTDRSSFWQFTVSDNGPGIAPENHQKIFGIFQTLVRRDDPKGTGIGLSIVKKIVESRGGTVWVTSKVGQGSAFSFTWPIA